MALIRTWGGTNPTAGGASGIGERFLRDPDAMDQLELQRQGQKFNQGLQSAKFNLGRDAFNSIMPYAQQALQGMSGLVGGATAPQPGINANPIWNPQQIQQQVNSAWSGNAERTNTLMKQLNESAAARGFGQNSPAIQAMGNQLGVANMNADQTAAREIPWMAAQGNADQNFRVNQLQQQQWAQGQDVDIKRRQSNQQMMNQLMQLLGSFGG